MSTLDAAVAPPALPDRAGHVVAGLAAPFRAAQVDALAASVCWVDGSWVVSTDAWADRRLGRLDARTGQWSPVASPPGWARQPRAVAGRDLTAIVHDRNADDGRLVMSRGGRWEAVEDGVEVGSVTDWDGRRAVRRDGRGHARALTATGEPVRVDVGDAGELRLVLGDPAVGVGLPPGCTVTQLAPSPGRDLVAVVVRRGAAFQTRVFSVATGEPRGGGAFGGTVHGPPLWWDEDRLVVVVERWPSLVPVVWCWKDGTTEELWPAGRVGTVRSMAASPSGELLAAVSGPDLPRRLLPLDVPPPVPGAGDDGVSVRAEVVTRDGQPLPCLVYEPPGRPRGTVCYFPGGPHEPMWGEYAAFSRSLCGAGWRVVRANPRSAGLREGAYHPRAGVRYGIDDALDALAVVETLGEGPVVTMGMSYGGYMATLAGERAERCRGIVVLSGFLSRADLAATRHEGVQRFVTEAFATEPPEPDRLTRPVLVAHGSADPRVPIEVVRAHRRRATASFTFVELTGQGHAIISDHDARVTYPQVMDWLDELVPR